MSEPQTKTITEAWAAVPVLEVDSSQDDVGDGDSLYESGDESTTTSLTSSVFNYVYANGRRYQSYREGNYALPNDETEQDRLDIFHHIYLLLLDGNLHLAPITANPNRILDVGTGTGIWAIDVADQYPSAEVIGTDLSPIQPGWVPPNLHFIVDDAESPWVFKKDSFDLIHARTLSGGIKDWEGFFQQCYEHLKPGGWLEIQDHEFDENSDDGTYNKDTAMWKYYHLVNEAAEKTGRVLHIAHTLKDKVVAAGFTEVHHKMYKLPLGTWPKDKRQKELGRWFWMAAESGFEAFGLALLTRVLGMKTEEIQELIRESKEEVLTRKVHAYNWQHVIFAQKPLE